jgi:S-adenosylmethionine hydrolase
MGEQMTKLKYIFHKVVCDKTNNTQEDIENQVVNVDIYGEIISPIEEIIIDITATEKEMTENHSIVINLENARIGCPYCDEWEPFFGTRGGDTQFLCDELLKDHLRRLEK